jgi:minor extracellular protease Epr
MGKFTQSFGRPLVRATVCLVGAGVLSSLPALGQVQALRLVWGIQDAHAKKERAKDSTSNWEVMKSEPVPSADGSPWSQSTQGANPKLNVGEESSKPGAKSSNAAAQPDGQAIPRTLHGLLKQWFSSASSEPTATAAPRTTATRQNDLTMGVQAAKGGPPASKGSAPVRSNDALARKPAADLALRLAWSGHTQILAKNLNAASLEKAIALGMKVDSIRDIGVLGYSVTQLSIPQGLDIFQAMAALQQVAPDTALTVNQKYHVHPESNDGDAFARPSPEAAKPAGGCSPERCYGATAIGWHDHLRGCARDLKIGVIDTGIDGSHPALSREPERINYGTIGPEKRVAGNEQHGTGVLALLAGDPRSSTPGLIPRATFYVANIFFADEKGQPVSTTIHLLEALDWMNRLQVDIINLSLSGPKDDLVQMAIARMTRSQTVDGEVRFGTIFVAAAGNGGPGAPPSYPAAYSEVLAVTAVGKNMSAYRRANQGDFIDVSAPGVDIWTALPGGRQGFQTGTSFAAPFVTAVVASIYNALPKNDHTKTALLQRLHLQDLGRPGPDPIYGRGLINAPRECAPERFKLTPLASRR